MNTDNTSSLLQEGDAGEEIKVLREAYAQVQEERKSLIEDNNALRKNVRQLTVFVIVLIAMIFIKTVFFNQ